MASLVMLAFVAFETQGFAGHYRTLINQLLSYLYGGVSTQICHYLDFSYLLCNFLVLLYTAMQCPTEMENSVMIARSPCFYLRISLLTPVLRV